MNARDRRLAQLEAVAQGQLNDLGARLAAFLARRSEWAADEAERGAQVDSLLELARERQNQHAPR